MQTLQGPWGKVSAVALTFLLATPQPPGVPPTPTSSECPLHMLFKLLFYCRAARYGCVDWAHRTVGGVPDMGSSVDGVPWQPWTHTTTWMQAVVCSDSSHRTCSLGNPLLHWTACCLLTFSSSPDFSGLCVLYRVFLCHDLPCSGAGMTHTPATFSPDSPLGT